MPPGKHHSIRPRQLLIPSMRSSGSSLQREMQERLKRSVGLLGKGSRRRDSLREKPNSRSRYPTCRQKSFVLRLNWTLLPHRLLAPTHLFHHLDPRRLLLQGRGLKHRCHRFRSHSVAYLNSWWGLPGNLLVWTRDIFRKFLRVHHQLRRRSPDYHCLPTH